MGQANARRSLAGNWWFPLKITHDLVRDLHNLSLCCKKSSPSKVGRKWIPRSCGAIGHHFENYMRTINTLSTAEFRDCRFLCYLCLNLNRNSLPRSAVCGHMWELFEHTLRYPLGQHVLALVEHTSAAASKYYHWSLVEQGVLRIANFDFLKIKNPIISSRNIFPTHSIAGLHQTAIKGRPHNRRYKPSCISCALTISCAPF